MKFLIIEEPFVLRELIISLRGGEKPGQVAVWKFLAQHMQLAWPRSREQSAVESEGKAEVVLGIPGSLKERVCARLFFFFFF